MTDVGAQQNHVAARLLDVLQTQIEVGTDRILDRPAQGNARRADIADFGALELAVNPVTDI